MADPKPLDWTPIHRRAPCIHIHTAFKLSFTTRGSIEQSMHLPACCCGGNQRTSRKHVDSNPSSGTRVRGNTTWCATMSYYYEEVIEEVGLQPVHFTSWMSLQKNLEAHLPCIYNKNELQFLIGTPVSCYDLLRNYLKSYF